MNFSSIFALFAGPIPTGTITAPVVEPTETPLSGATEPATTQVVELTQSPSPTNTPVPTHTQTSSILLTTTPVVCPDFNGITKFENNARFVADLTIPDGTVLSPGKGFVKTWYVQNTGTSTWTLDYVAAFGKGESMSALLPFHFPSDVSPRQCVEISIQMVAPKVVGSYFGLWLLQISERKDTTFGFGDTNLGGLSVNIVVQSPATTP